MDRQLAYRYFLHPRYWGVWFLLFLGRLIAFLPHRFQLFLARGIGFIAYHLMSSRRRVTEVNIGACFPELDASSKNRLVKDSFKSNAMGLIEALGSWYRKPASYKSLTHCHGLEHLEAALAKGKGVILLGGHYSTLDIAGSLTTLFFKADVVQRDHSNPLFNAFMTRSRLSRYGAVLSKKDIRGMVRSLRQNHVVWYATDQDSGRRGTIFAPFFGHKCATLPSTMRLAKMTGAAVLPFSHFRRKDKLAYDIYIHPELENFPSESVEEDAARLNKIIEDEIRKAPEQYLWMHRRFKTPEEPGSKNIYQQYRN